MKPLKFFFIYSHINTKPKNKLNVFFVQIGFKYRNNSQFILIGEKHTHNSP